MIAQDPHQCSARILAASKPPRHNLAVKLRSRASYSFRKTYCALIIIHALQREHISSPFRTEEIGSHPHWAWAHSPLRPHSDSVNYETRKELNEVTSSTSLAAPLRSRSSRTRLSKGVQAYVTGQSREHGLNLDL